jgi:PKD repeat protein
VRELKTTQANDSWMWRAIWLWVLAATLSFALVPNAVGHVADTSALLSPHAPILIQGDLKFRPANGVTGGTGTVVDPYIIEGWDVNASAIDGIQILDTTAYFIIRNLTVHSGTGHSGIYMQNVTDGRVEDTVTTGDEQGIFVDHSARISISGSAMSADGYGILASNSTGLTVHANNVTVCTWGGIHFSNVTNVTVTDNTFERSSEGQQALAGAVFYESSGGRVYHNNFIHTGAYGFEAGGSATTNFSWDDGYPSGGNYWSYYSGIDANGDGIGDTSQVLWPEGVDRYPLILPLGRPPIPPVAIISTDNPSPFAEQTIVINGDQSVDADGIVHSYSWDFGDGTSGLGIGNFHRYMMPGNYTVTLTVTDNSGLTNSTGRVFRVLLPTAAPTAYFQVGAPQPLFPGVAAYFGADGSSTQYGTLVSYAWDFGDGSTEEGIQTSHIFASSGTYRISLTVTNSWGASASASQYLSVAAVPEIPLVPYSHPSGFRLPVPENWSLSENEQFGGQRADLVLRGPIHDGFRTNILVYTVHDSGLREDRASMESLVRSLIDGLRNNDASLFVSEGPTYRIVSGHSAVEFAVEYGSNSVEQKVAIVVSEPHQEAWLILLSVRTAYYPLYNATFELMVDGFVITAPPPAPTILIIGAAAAGATAAVALVVLLVRRRGARRPASSGSSARGFAPLKVEKGLRTRECPSCGGRVEAQHRFCGHCGTQVGGLSTAPGQP